MTDRLWEDEELRNIGRLDGLCEAHSKSAPLVQAIRDAIFMFEDIEKARQLPAYGNVVAQYVAMGKELRRQLEQSGLE